MAYNESTPASINESFSVSQPKIAANFAAIKTVVEQDHEAFNGADEGKHKQVLFTEQAAATSTAADEMAFYVKDNAGSPNLYLRLESDGTEFNVTPDVTGHANPGYEVLPSGLVINWGTVTIASGSTNGNQALAKSITTLYGFSFGVRSANGNITTAKNITLTAKTVAAGTLTLQRGGTDDTVYFDYIAIGK